MSPMRWTAIQAIKPLRPYIAAPTVYASTEQQDKVYAALLEMYRPEQPVKRELILLRVDCCPRGVSEALNLLAKSSRARSPKRGFWEPIS